MNSVIIWLLCAATRWLNPIAPIAIGSSKQKTGLSNQRVNTFQDEATHAGRINYLPYFTFFLPFLEVNYYLFTFNY